MKLESSFWWFLTPFKTRSKIQLPAIPYEHILPNLQAGTAVSGCPSDTHECYSAGPCERLLVMKISNNVRLVRHIWEGTGKIKSLQR